MKNDWMQIKMKQFDFCETRFHKTFFDCASTFVQTKKNFLIGNELNEHNFIITLKGK